MLPFASQNRGGRLSAPLYAPRAPKCTMPARAEAPARRGLRRAQRSEFSAPLSRSGRTGPAGPLPCAPARRPAPLNRATVPARPGLRCAQRPSFPAPLNRSNRTGLARCSPLVPRAAEPERPYQHGGVFVVRSGRRKNGPAITSSYSMGVSISARSGGSRNPRTSGTT
jgi:hypothetical protein